MTSADVETARAFASSWNNLPSGSVYTLAQFEDWMAPLQPADLAGKDVLELGCGNASLLVHACGWNPRRIVGVDLGDSVVTARRNTAGFPAAEIEQGDLVSYQSPGFDVVYCIGVLHHLKQPRAGFESVVRNTRPGGRFHCWVYAHEGNALVRLVVEPLRRLTSRLPWWFTKYLVATPAVAPYYLHAKLIGLLGTSAPAWLPLRDYSLWIARREFAFFRHVAFDQLVTPQTAYIRREEIERWLAQVPGIAAGSGYVILRNGNSWKFGGTRSPEGT